MARDLTDRAWLAYDLKSTPKFVLLFLADRADDKTRQCWVSIATIATLCGINSEKTVIAAVGKLEKANWIKVTRSHRHTHLYDLTPLRKRIYLPPKTKSLMVNSTPKDESPETPK